MEQSAVQLYYWSVKFEDGTILSCFDKDGNEIHFKDICPKKYIESGKIKENCNVFEDLEKVHGRVTNIGWYPFSEELSRKCIKKQSTLRIATSEDLKAIEQEIPPTFYSSFLKKANTIKYGIEQRDDIVEMKPLESVQAQLHMTLVPRDSDEEPLSTVIDLRYR